MQSVPQIAAEYEILVATLGEAELDDEVGPNYRADVWRALNCLIDGRLSRILPWLGSILDQSSFPKYLILKANT